MKRIRLYLTLLVLAFIMSCGGPDLVLINSVNKDGSVTRRVVMTWDKDEFDLDECHVPVDSTWNISRSSKITGNDTVYTLVAEKKYNSVEEINAEYESYGGVNRLMTRWATFEKRFRWFNTAYYFSESVKGAIDGYPPEDFLKSRELELFYMPEEIIDTFLEGPDSINYKILNDSREVKMEMWILRSLVKDAVKNIIDLSRTGEFAPIDTTRIRMIEVEFAGAVDEVDGDEYEIIDHIMGDGYYDANRKLLDSALSISEKKFSVAMDADRYVIQTRMPGDLVSTNGYIDSEGIPNWEVNGDVILSGDYVMWAESNVTNWWAWIVTIVFLLFVATGLFSKKH